MPDLIGETIGSYKLERLIGEGGFAEVYLGVHIRLGTQAAVKILKREYRTPEDIARLKNESQVMSQFDHKHIMRVYDCDVHNDIPFLVMEYAPHGTLKYDSHLSLARVTDYVDQVAKALQYAHDHHVIHRDIKPDNMLRNTQDEILLSDFGIAIPTDSHTNVDTLTREIKRLPLAGTIEYMAPEHIRGNASRASDQYSLGIVVYEWLCGTRPFHGTGVDIGNKHILEPPLPPRQRRPAIPSATEAVVLQALKKEPTLRYPTITDFSKAFQKSTKRRVTPTYMPYIIASIPAYVLIILLIVGLIFGFVKAPWSPPGQSPSPVITPSPANIAPTPNCIPGTLTIGSSSAFEEGMKALVQGYQEHCSRTILTVNTDPTKSILEDIQAGNFLLGSSDTPAATTQTALVGVGVAVVPFTIVVNPEVKKGIDTISPEDLKKIYTGQIQYWEQVQGWKTPNQQPPTPIYVVSRVSSSGTRQVFEHYVLDGCENLPPHSPNHEEFTKTTQAVTAVEVNSGAIGYVDRDNAEIAGNELSTLSIGGQDPGYASIISKNYQFWSVEYLYTKGEPNGLAKAFRDYVKEGSRDVINTLEVKNYYHYGTFPSETLSSHKWTSLQC